MVTLQLIPPPTFLRNYVRYFSLFDCKDAGLPPQSVMILADRHPRLLFQCLEGRSTIRQESGDWLAPAFLSGIDTQPTRYSITGPYTLVGVSFYPHALHCLFGIDAYELNDTSVDLASFCPGSLLERMFEAVSHDERIVLLSQFLIERLQRNNLDTQLIDDSFFRQHLLATSASVDEIVSHYPLSQRQLERRFRQWVGVSPKMYLRLLRFEQAQWLLDNAQFQQVQDIAFALNYADHSHFTREFRTFSGYTPKEYLRVHNKVQESAAFIVDEQTIHRSVEVTHCGP